MCYNGYIERFNWFINNFIIIYRKAKQFWPNNMRYVIFLHTNFYIYFYNNCECNNFSVIVFQSQSVTFDPTLLYTLQCIVLGEYKKVHSFLEILMQFESIVDASVCRSSFLIGHAFFAAPTTKHQTSNEKRWRKKNFCISLHVRQSRCKFKNFQKFKEKWM